MGFVKYAVLLVAAFVSVTLAYPAQNSDVEFVPINKQSPRPPHPVRPELPGFVDDDIFGDSDDEGYFPNPFYFTSGLYDNIAAMLTRLRAQLAAVTPRFPSQAGDTGIVFPNLNLPGIGDMDLGKGNTTSVTKIIDGKKVVINETEYKKEGEHGGAFFKVRIIDVRPADDDASTGKEATSTVATSREVEALEDSLENEIPKTKEGILRYDNIESFDDVDIAESDKTWKPIAGPFDSNGLEQMQPYRDLSNDIYVNQLMQDAGAPMNPDAEMIDDIDNEMFVKDLRRRL